jgi:hypothetical protein
MAGVACWVSTYPIDSIKSNIQAVVLDRPVSIKPDGSVLHEMAKMHSNFGYRGFMNGVVAIMGRAFFANAVGFWLWEYSKTLISLQK